MVPQDCRCIKVYFLYGILGIYLLKMYYGNDSLIILTGIFSKSLE